MITIVKRWPYLMLALLALTGAAAPAAAYPRPGATERVSFTPDGTTAPNSATGAGSWVEISPDGRFVTFMSAINNIVPGDTDSEMDIFVRDRETGAIELVSIAPDGTQSGLKGGAWTPSISADGRFVAFGSGVLLRGKVFYSNLVRDREAGTTEIVDVSNYATPGVWGSRPSEISADGRFVAWVSANPDVVEGDTNGGTDDIEGSDVFVRDLINRTTERVSVASDGTEGQGGAYGGACFDSIDISADGRFVVFQCTYPNLVAGDTNDLDDIFVHDRFNHTTERVSVRSDGSEVKGRGPFLTNGFSTSISADGRFVTFGGSPSGFVPTNPQRGAADYVHDRETGTTERVSVSSDGSEIYGEDSNWFSRSARISPDGRYVAFTTIFEDDVLRARVYDRATGTTERLSFASDGTEGNDEDMVNWVDSVAPSADARYVAFVSLADNLVAGDNNESQDVFVRDRGPAAGIGGLNVQERAGGHTATGWATFSGATAASAEDSLTDGDDAAGAELTAASLIHRPELEDLQLRIDLASLPVTEVKVNPEPKGPVCGLPVFPQVPPWQEDCKVGYDTLTYGGTPGTLYRLRFALGQAAYEVRALPATPDAPFRGALYRCTPECTETATLAGGVGTTGNQVRVSLPLDALGVDGAADLTGLEASVVPPGASAAADALSLPDAHIEPPQVELGVAPAAAPADEVALTTAAELVDGRFSAAVDTSALAGPLRLWGRGCLTLACGFGGIDFTIPAAAPANQTPPLIEGTPGVGSRLTCRPGTWSGRPAPTLAYQWLRDGGAIAGATTDSYPLIDADAATAVACRVTATNSEGSRPVASAAVTVPAVPPSAGSAVVDGSPDVGAVLTCVPSGFGGAPAPSYAYQWRRDDAAIAGATSATYTVTADDAGHALTCLVTATNPGGSADAASPARAIPALPGGTADPTGTTDPAGTPDPTGTPTITVDAPTAQRTPAADDSQRGRGAPLQIEVRSAALRHSRARRLRLKLISSEPVTRLTASLSQGKRKYGRGRLARLERSRMLTVRLTRPLRRGTYRLRLVARRPDGSTARVAVRIRVR